LTNHGFADIMPNLLYNGLTDMGHIWYKGLMDIGFDGLTLRSPP